MIDYNKAQVGDRVHYIGHLGGIPENGRIKEIPSHTRDSVRVVYNCANEWDKFMNYTSALTPIDCLFDGWTDNARNYKQP